MRDCFKSSEETFSSQDTVFQKIGTRFGKKVHFFMTSNADRFIKFKSIQSMSYVRSLKSWRAVSKKRQHEKETATSKSRTRLLSSVCIDLPLEFKLNDPGVMVIAVPKLLYRVFPIG